MLKINGNHQKIIIMGTQQEYQTWTRRFATKVENVTFLRAKNAEVFRSKHSRTTKVLILSDPDGLLLSSKVVAKINKLKTINREVFEKRILDQYVIESGHQDMMIYHFGSGVAEVVKSLNGEG